MNDTLKLSFPREDWEQTPASIQATVSSLMQALVGSQETLAQVVQELNATNANSQISKEIVEQLIPLAVEHPAR